MLKLFVLTGLLLSMMGLPISAQTTLPLYWVAPTDFEVGVPYSSSLPVGKIVVGCALDDYSHVVDWGDGTTGVATTPGAAYTIFYNGMWRTLVGPGTFSLYATTDKQYALSAAGHPLTVKITSTLHCLDATTGAVWQVNAAVNVHPRTPLKEIHVAPAANN